MVQMFGAEARGERMVRVAAVKYLGRAVSRLTACAGTVLVWTVCEWAQTAKQVPDPAIMKPDPTPAVGLVKPGAAPSVAPAVSTDSASLSAAVIGKAWKRLYEGLAEKNYDRRAQAISALGTIGLE